MDSTMFDYQIFLCAAEFSRINRTSLATMMLQAKYSIDCCTCLGWTQPTKHKGLGKIHS